MAIYISRPRFKGLLRHTSKDAPVSGRSYMPALQEHEPVRVPHFQGWRQTYKGVGRGEEVFCLLDLPLPYSFPLDYIRPPKTGFPSESGFFILISEACLGAQHMSASAMRARADAVK